MPCIHAKIIDHVLQSDWPMKTRSAFHLYRKTSRSGGTTNGTVDLPTGNFSEKKEQLQT